MKTQLRLWAALAVLIVVFNVVAFVIPFTHTAVFWTGYGVTWLSFALAAFAGARSMGRPGLQSKLLGWPILRSALAMLGVQLAAFLALAGTAKLCPVRVAVIVEALVIAATILLLITREASRDHVEHSEQRVEDRTAAWKAIRAKAAELAGTDAEWKKLAEDIRYADPMPRAIDTDIAAALKAEDKARVKQLLASRRTAAKA